VTHPYPGGEVVLLRAGAEVARWPLPPCADLALVDALARLQLAAIYAGGRIELRAPPDQLMGLLDLVGLSHVLREGDLPVEVGGEAEGGEEVGVEKVVVPDDPFP